LTPIQARNEAYPVLRTLLHAPLFCCYMPMNPTGFILICR